MSFENTLRGAYIGAVWCPKEDTVAYFPFDENKLDLVTWWPVLSDSAASITTTWWVTCLSIWWNTQSLNLTFSTWNVASWMVWVKWYSWTVVWAQHSQYATSARYFWVYNNTLTYTRTPRWHDCSVTWPTISSSQWHCIWFSEDSDWWRLYLDNNSDNVWYATTSSVWGSWASVTWLWCKTNQNPYYFDPATWYMSNLVLMKNSLTIETFLDFYNKTKSIYWIS